MRSWLFLLGLVACTENGEEGGGGISTDNACSSGLRWTGGNAESPAMHPGADCIGCHSSGEGPRFLIAGTVYATIDEPTDCLGVSGVTVTITDATGRTADVTSNDAGNFYLSAKSGLTMPIRASLAFEGRQRIMGAAQGTGACASCHTTTGASGAPGRILAP
jgi:hypothetical protein